MSRLSYHLVVDYHVIHLLGLFDDMTLSFRRLVNIIQAEQFKIAFNLLKSYGLHEELHIVDIGWTIFQLYLFIPNGLSNCLLHSWNKFIVILMQFKLSHPIHVDVF